MLSPGYLLTDSFSLPEVNNDTGSVSRMRLRPRTMIHTLSDSFDHEDTPSTPHLRRRSRDAHPRQLNGRYVCTQCQRDFPDQKSLKRHSMSHRVSREPRGDKKLRMAHRCVLCDVRFAQEEELVAHAADHPTGRTEPCTVCHATFSSVRGLREHTKVQHTECRYACTVCERRFSTAGKLAKHSRDQAQRSTDRAKHICNICARSYTTRKALKAHLVKHSRENEMMERDSETGEMRFRCPHCDETFTERNKLTIHLTTHTGEKKYACHICGKRVTQRASLWRHRRTHTGEQPYLCQLCGRRFNQSANLNAHLRMHTGERKHECETCGQRFQRANTLRKHAQRHLARELPPLRCHICRKGLQDQSKLEDHMKIHRGEGLQPRPYKCSVCDRGFTLPSRLANHEKIHSGEYEHQCHHCGIKFAWRTSFLNHMLNKHGVPKPQLPHVVRVKLTTEDGEIPESSNREAP